MVNCGRLNFFLGYYYCLLLANTPELSFKLPVELSKLMVKSWGSSFL